MADEVALTSKQLEQAYHYFLQKGASIAGLEDGGADLTQMYLAPVIKYSAGGTAAKLVRMSVSLLKAKEVMLKRDGNNIVWVHQGEDNSETLFTLEDIKGAPGQTPSFRTSGANGIEWKYEDEDDSEYRPLIAVDLLRLTFDQLTPEQKEELKLHFSDLSEAELLGLMQPALDAAKIAEEQMQDFSSAEEKRAANEETRGENETTRVAAEKERVENETDRLTAEALRKLFMDICIVEEQLRKTAENKRADAEDIRNSQESYREEATLQALVDVEEATKKLNEQAEHRDEIREDGWWYRWDLDQQDYVRFKKAQTDLILPVFSTDVKTGMMKIQVPQELKRLIFRVNDKKQLTYKYE